jgi:hypothetical protein
VGKWSSYKAGKKIIIKNVYIMTLHQLYLVIPLLNDIVSMIRIQEGIVTHMRSHDWAFVGRSA